jgi:hypothetical protein
MVFRRRNVEADQTEGVFVMNNDEKFINVMPIHSDIKKFWDGNGVSFFHQELPVNPYINTPEYDPRHNLLYYRSVGGFGTVIAKTLPYPPNERPSNIKYEIYYLNRRFDYNQYSEAEMLRIIKMKAFI